MLNELGWIKLKDGVNPLTASKADIAENPKNIKIVELEAAQLPRSRADVDFAIVNGNYAMNSSMKLTEALDELKFVGTDTASPHLIKFNGSDAGKPAYYWLRWVNKRGETGPWSVPVSATIVG